MSAYGTKKAGGDEAVQLTFPAVFSEAVARRPLRYAGAPTRRAAPLPAGDDEMARYHEQKRADAHRRVLNAVKDTKAAIRRYLVSPHGYYDLPPPERSQRVFANPSNGAGGIGGDIYSARCDTERAPFRCSGGGMVGGVLRTAEGQQYGRQLLRNRLRQLDAIDVAAAVDKEKTAAEGLPVPVAVEAGIPDVEGVARRLELSGLLGQISDAFATGTAAQLTAKDVNEFLQKLITFATVGNRQELEELIADVEATVQAAEGAEEEATARGRTERQIAFITRIVNKMIAARNYLVEMYANANRPLNERKKVSISAVRDAQLTALAPTEERRRLMPTAVGPFTPLARAREDDEAAARPAGRFARDNRDRFGAIAGAFAGEGEPDGEGGVLRMPARAPAARVAARADRDVLRARLRMPPAGVGAFADEDEGEGAPELVVDELGEAAPALAAAVGAPALPFPDALDLEGNPIRDRRQIPNDGALLRQLAANLRAQGIGFGYTPRAETVPRVIKQNFYRILRI
jgi:hypothetical protein